MAHLLSWESWNHRAAAEHRRVQQRVESVSQEAARFGALIELLRQYEAERHNQLKRVAQASDENPFRIGLRSIRAWDRVRQQWCGPRGDTRASRLEVLAALQTKLRGKFGDPELFRWLAADGRECLWREQDPLPLLARLNSHAGLLRRKKERALYTPPDAREHPRWTNYEAEGGSNLRTYKLAVEHSALAVGLPLLTSGQTGLREETFAIPLARSGQLESPAWNGLPGKQKRLTFRSAHQDFSASLGGSEVLLCRRHLENRKTEELARGDVGPIWFKLVLDVDSKAPQQWLDARGRAVTPPIVHHFNTGRATQSRHAASLQPGLRVLAVDLGLRSFAACSVFELVGGKPVAGVAFLADADRDLWARHERSFLLTLPGETPDGAALAARTAAYDQLGLIRRDVNRLKDLLRLQVKATAEERAAALEDLRKSIAQEVSNRHAAALTTSALDALERATPEAQPFWEDAVRQLYRHAETALSDRIRTWRRQTRPRAQDAEGRKQQRAYAGGKSVWAIEYLANIRRLLQGWSLHGRRYAQINRADRQKRGTFAARLLEHINALKEDRVKAGSDLIVQAARGFVPAEQKGWIKKYEPCRLILFEDLAGYLSRVDRPRRENRQLMLWNHREILAEVEMQAEIYGIVVGTTGAGFSSRFHARSGAPGCRVRILSRQDLESPWVQQQLESLATQLGIQSRRFCPGTRVPREGGEEFATLDAAGRPVVVHADLNAAQNLQRRFWTRHGDAYRLSAVEVRHGDRSFWYPQRDGTRLRGALAAIVGDNGYARLVSAADGDGFVLEPVTARQWRTATGAGGVTGDEEGLDELEAELAEVAGDDFFERGAAGRLFFRDPSGFLLRPDRWYEAKVFWGRVERGVAVALGSGVAVASPPA